MGNLVYMVLQRESARKIAFQLIEEGYPFEKREGHAKIRS